MERKKFPILTTEQQQLVQSWQGLVKKIVRKCFRHLDPDAMSEGNVGLCFAAMKFDPNRTSKFDPSTNIKFSTYATWWIRAYVLREVVRRASSDINIIKTSEEKKVFFNLARVRNNFQLCGIEPSPENIAKKIGVPTRDVERVIVGQTPLVQFQHPQGPYREVRDFPDRNAESLDDEVAKREEMAKFRTNLKICLPRLSKREAFVIKKRHMGKRTFTLKEVSDVMDISRERVRQIETEAFAKLRRWLGAKDRKAKTA